MLAVCLLCPIISHAQQIVIDPSQIAASATNAAEQVDYMLDQLGELAHLGEQMNTVSWWGNTLPTCQNTSRFGA